MKPMRQGGFGQVDLSIIVFLTLLLGSEDVGILLALGQFLRA